MLYQANSDSERGRMMMQRMMEDVKILHFDGIHTLKFIFHSRRIAKRYRGLACRVQGTCLELEESDGMNQAGGLGEAQLRRQYSVRVYHGEEVGLVALLAALGNLPDVTIIDAERPRTDSTEIVDNRYCVIHFKGQACPAELRGVTKINMGGALITVHHHLVHARLPCSRCYAPFHTAGLCRTKPTQVGNQRDRYQRTYAGAIPKFQVGQAVQYDHSDDESLTSFLTTLQGEIEAEIHRDGTRQSGSLQRPPELSTHTTTSSPEMGDELARSQTAQAAMGSSVGQGSESEPQLADQGGYQVYRRKAKKGKSDEDRQSPVDPSGKGQAATASRAKRQSSTNKKKTQRPPSFASFNNARAWGRFSELADAKSDSEGDEEASDSDEQDEAPYAYGAAEDAGNYNPTFPTRPTMPGQAEATTGEGVDGMTMEVDDVVSSDISGYVGSSQPSQELSEASTPGSEFPYSVASDEGRMRDGGGVNGTSSSQQEPRDERGSMTGTPTMAERDEHRDMVIEGPEQQPERERDCGHKEELSQDGFEVGHTVYPQGMPQQLPTFLNDFGGTLVEVPANGQCAYAALYATTSYIEGGNLVFTSEAVRNANLIKRNVYTIMMTNLAQDVECGLVDPMRELTRLYPLQLPPTGTAAAVTLLYTHYAQERARSVNTQIPSEFWAGAEVLRAMAQYLREPVFVFDVDRRNDAHVQRYYYQQYRTEAGEPHESGCGGAMEDTKAKEMLQQYARIHVLPVMLVLKKHEGHFYGVHHGDIAIRWMVEGDRGFAEANCSEHTWFEEILEHMAYSTAKLPTTNIKEDSAAADSVIIGTMEHRSRLDVVHDRLGLPRLDAVAFDLDHMATNLTQEGERLQRAAGPQIHSEVTDTTVEADADNLDRNTRFPMRAHDRVAFEPMQRILDSIGMEPELVSDRNKVRYLIQVNNQALATWRSRLPARSALAAELKGQDGIAAVVEVLLRHRRDLHPLFSYLPYPELAAKMLPAKLIQKWGELEAYDVRVDTLREVEHRDGARPAAVTLCRA